MIMFNKIIIIKHFYISKMICLHKSVRTFLTFDDTFMFLLRHLSVYLFIFGVFVFSGISLEGLFYHISYAYLQ